MSRAIGAHLEGELRERYEEAEEAAPEENKSAFLRSVVVGGLDAKERDALDAIGASEELRATVEARREEGEPLDDAVRRLVREGADVSAPAAKRRRTARNFAEMAALLTISFGILSVLFGELLTRPLPLIEVSVRFVVGSTVIGLLGFHAVHRGRAAVARRRDSDRGAGGDD